MRRFWTEVAVVAEPGGLGIALDGKPVRTPGRRPLLVAVPALAEAIAAEWRGVGETLNPGAMPFTGLANAAIERVAPDPAAFAAGLAAYAASDLLCYRADGPAPLLARQRAAWDPLLAWARRRYDVHFAVVTGVMPQAQPPATLARLGEAVAARTPFELAALAPVVTVSGTLVGALALAETAVSAEDLWSAIRIDDDWQAERWGRDPLAEAAESARRTDFEAGARMLAMLI